MNVYICTPIDLSVKTPCPVICSSSAADLLDPAVVSIYLCGSDVFQRILFDWKGQCTGFSIAIFKMFLWCAWVHWPAEGWGLQYL